MNYYEHHLGDWAAATAHLTWDEDMAYTRLLRAYYHQEGAIVKGQQYRLARASTPAQLRAVDSVLAEFFTLSDGAFHQKRADAEIERFRDKQRKAKASAEARWSHTERNANASPNAMRTHGEGNALQTPDARHQTPRERESGEPPPVPLAPEPDLTGLQPTQAGLACRAIKAAGVIDVNPGHAGLLRLLDGGVTVAELASTAEELVGKGKGKFALLLATVEGRRVDAAAAGDVAKAPEVVDPGAAAAEKTRREQAEFAARPVSRPPDSLKALAQKLKVSA